MKKKNTVRRMEPEFPKWKNPKTGAGFILGALLWILMLLLFFLMLYAAWFTQNLIYLLKLIKDRDYQIPIWLSVLCVCFLFPVTLIIIIGGTLTKIIREAE